MQFTSEPYRSADQLKGRWTPAIGYLQKYDELIAKSNNGQLTSAELTFLVEKFDPAELFRYDQERKLSKTLLTESEFGKRLWDPDVVILDPCTGTGSFIVNLMRCIAKSARRDLPRVYREQLFANEVMLMPYYIAALNIEHTCTEINGHYDPFPGLCFVDTLDIPETGQIAFFVQENTKRVEDERKAEITVILGNPPYNVGQLNENDNNKNRKYKETDPLVRKTAFDGIRKHLARDFHRIYHLDLRGDVRENPKLSGTAYNVFGIQVGVGITIAVRRAGLARGISYHAVPLEWRRQQKLAWLHDQACAANVQSGRQLSVATAG